MKSTRIFPLLLITLATLFAPRMASAQKFDTLFISPDCGSDPGWDFGFLNNHPEFVNRILFTIDTTGGVGFAGANPTGDNIQIWDDSTNAIGDSLTYFPLNGGGIGSGVNDSGFYFLLGGLNGNSFPYAMFDHPITVCWHTFAGNAPVNSGCIQLLPTLFQGNCFFDSVSASGSTVGCDPTFNFCVFNKNGPTLPITSMKFELEGISAGSIRPGDVQAPQGWVVDTVTQFDVTFSTGGGINPRSSLCGFIIPVRANPAATQFTFVWRAYNQGGLIDRDTVFNIAATPQLCSENPSEDTLTIANAGDCNFLINAKNYHNKNGADTVSTITNWTFTITTPGVTFGSAILPPQAIPGTWSFSGVGTNTLHFFEVSKYLIDPQYAQPGGTIWTPRFTLDDPNPGEPVTIVWNDSNITAALSSGTNHDMCNNSRPDTAWVETVGSCSYLLIVENYHTNPASSISAISMSIPPSGGSFRDTACFSSSNGWEKNVPLQSARFTNLAGPSGFLHSGSFDTIHFCIDPAQPNASWPLTWTTIDSTNSTLYSGTITVPGCTPPLVCDSIQHLHLNLNSKDGCSDTIVVLNQREGGASIDSIVVTPSNGWTIASASVSPPWNTAIAAGNGSVTIFGGTIGAGTSKGFIVDYNTGGTASAPVQVTTLAGGVSCPNDQTLSCQGSGVSPSSIPQTLDVSVVPNPMNQEAQITLTTGVFDRVQMSLLDVLGRTSKMVVDGTISAGDHSYTLDVSQLPMGTYYLRIEASGATMTKKLVIEH